MLRMMFLVSFWLPVTLSALAQDSFVCGRPTGRSVPVIVFEDRGNPAATADQLNDQISHYLNTTGSVEGLQSAITTSAQDNAVTLKAEVIEADFTADNAADVLTNVTVSYGAMYGEYLSLFACTSDGYALLDTVLTGGWDPGGDDIPSSIVLAVDLNNNQRREIVLHVRTIVGQKSAEGLVIYEGDGASLAQVFALEPDYGAFSRISATNHDHDPATLELTISSYYGYGEETASAVSEISHWRPIDVIYQWNSTAFVQLCTYFTDDPFTLYETIQSAETRRACGLYDDALVFYERIWQPDYERIPWNEGELETWGNSGWLIIPESVADSDAYAADLERAYLRAFAGYRMMQMSIALGDPYWADYLVRQLGEQYSPGDHGYVYAAMATALWQTFQETRQISDACAAAETAFHTAIQNGDDPGIAYDDQGLSNLAPHFFYRYGVSFAYSPNPDNLFDVPEDVQGILDISICL